MADKLKLKAGSRISSETILYEEYQKEDNQIIANVSIDKIEDVFLGVQIFLLQMMLRNLCALSF